MKYFDEDKFAEQVKQIGLSDKAAIVYAALLELGGAFPSKVAEVAKLNRSTTYKILVDLAVKGLVNEGRKRHKLFYQIEKPQKLLQYAKDQVRVSEDRLERAAKIVPELDGLFQALDHKPRIRFFEGVQDIIEMYDDHLNVDKPYEMLAVCNATQYLKFIPRSFHETYVKKKERLGIKTRGIIPDLPSDLRYNKVAYKKIKTSIHPQLRAIPSEKFFFPADMTIYADNRVSILNIGEHGLVGVIIEDKTIHDMMKMIFELAWAGAKALYGTVPE